MRRLAEWLVIVAPAAVLFFYKVLPLLHLGAHVVGAPHPH